MFKKCFIGLVVLITALQTSAQSTDFRILSWNIFMIPPTIFKSCQCERTGFIANAVKQWDADVIIFQEAFQKKARTLIYDLIKEQYPYETGVPNGGFLKVHSGVWIVSRYPILRQESIVYKEKRGSDKFAKKGATFIEIEINGQKIQVIGTHVQSGSKHQAIRDVQFKQLIMELGNKYMDFKIPQFIGGDLNTDVKITKDYEHMLVLLDAMNTKHSGQPFSWNGAENNLGAKFFGTQQETLDYILLRKQHKDLATILKHEILSPITKEAVCKRGFNAMSDHYPVMAEIELK